MSEWTDINQIIRIVFHFLADKDFDELDDYLAACDVSVMSDGQIMAMLRSAFAARDRLPEWQKLARRAIAELLMRNDIGTARDIENMLEIP